MYGYIHHNIHTIWVGFPLFSWFIIHLYFFLAISFQQKDCEFPEIQCAAALVYIMMREKPLVSLIPWRSQHQFVVHQRPSQNAKGKRWCQRSKKIAMTTAAQTKYRRAWKQLECAREHARRDYPLFLLSAPVLAVFSFQSGSRFMMHHEENRVAVASKQTVLQRRETVRATVILYWKSTATFGEAGNRSAKVKLSESIDTRNLTAHSDQNRCWEQRTTHNVINNNSCASTIRRH